MSHKEIVVIGGGLAGCEAAWQAAGRGCRVTLFEMKPGRHSPAHRSADLAELVCSNSFKSTSLENASGLLKAELRLCGSLIEEQARRCGVPAGQALAVDRERFAAAVTAEIERHPRINVVREECRDVAAGSITVIATGPLTSEAFSAGLQQLLGNSFLYFHDAIAPIVEEESIDRQKVFRASRYNKGTADYLNCPLTQDEYYAFIEALLAAEKVPLREFESLVPFEGCMPVEIMAGRGIETLAYGPMKPVGLVDPRTERQSYAVVQLRTENQAETLYNLVGFQTRL
ncbi:MAG: methylenetetrahydrofolate--tRNA-(uracil(54)-C(5))-methyltransferase (FADH(2)-oxidizing) TrmFO, partial [Deltaproteobacteria bacterium]|nr:methylenetetrahydrofolate--tRNA-(uracil(54)-C(5))-methyltransferase (FADH(2)-oxidizing) TrmFO [Deltaproteobacteria bacterium]